MPAHDGSSSSDLIAGFHVRRRLGDSLWEAVQPELGRRVALRRLEPGTSFAAGEWPERAGVVKLYAVVERPEGFYVATRFVPGARTLAELRGARAGRRRRWVDAAAAALEGTVHGALTEHDVLVDADGRAWITGFGQARPGATAADDRAALERMRPAERRGRRALPLAAAAAVAATVTLLVLRSDGRGSAAAPPVPRGATAIGSALAAGAYDTVDCDHRPPSGSSRPCTIMQTALSGRPLVARHRSLVTGWAVRGASGRITLQVLEPGPHGFVSYNHTHTVTVTDPRRAQYFHADRSVPVGARFAIEVDPGGGVGMRREAAAATARFFGPLRTPARQPTNRRRGEELLLRVDLIPPPR